MNATRRTQITRIKVDIAESIDDIKSLFATIQEWKESLESARDEELEYYDEMPASFQRGEKGDAAVAAIDNLEQSISKLDDFTPLEDHFDEIQTLLDQAIE